MASLRNIFAGGLIACVAALTVVGCAATPTTQGQAPATDAAPMAEPGVLGAADTPSAADGDHALTPLFAQFTRVDMRVTTDLEPAWALAKTAAIDPAQIALWQANGLRAGLIEAKDAAAFRAALAQAVGNRVQLMHGAPDRQVPLPLTPPLERPARVKVVTDARGVEQIITLPPGRTQFLLRLTPIADGQRVLVELTPHHFVPHTTVEVRTPEQKMLDGRVFQSLTLSAQVRPDDLLIVGLPPIVPPTPPSRAPTPAPASPGAPAVTNQVSSEGAPSVGEADAPGVKPDKPGLHWLPDRLGTLLLASTWRNQPVHSILVIAARVPAPDQPR